MGRWVTFLLFGCAQTQPPREFRTYSAPSAEPQDEPQDDSDDTPPVRPRATGPTSMPPPPPPGEDEPPCPDGVTCVTALPYHDDNDTATATADGFDAYACAPATAEGGHERIYRVKATSAGLLSAAVYDGAGVDVDVHILSELSASSCLDRGDKHARADVEVGYYYIVVDSYVSGGVPQEGAYQLDIGLLQPSSGPCAMDSGEMPRVGDGGDTLRLPATGPLVQEAHLVTQDEPAPYPTSSRDQLAEHYGLSQAKSGLIMNRTQTWAPLEGGSFYGAGIGSPSLFPMLDEAYYVCMYWTATARPARGTRMIIRKPGTDHAVVVAAGYETGPGNLDRIGGAPEEVHFYLRTQHLSTVTLGMASDQSLPLGPRRCTD